MSTASLPEVTVVDAFEGIDAVQASVSVNVSHVYELPHGERTVIDAVIRWSEPELLFEFGTYTGSTTVVMATAAPPGAVVHTIDRPVEACGPDLNAQIGSAIRAAAPTVVPIVEHRQFIQDFDFTEWRSRVDLVFVDASHDHDDVVRDSRIAVELVRPGGVVIWDDYQSAHPGVVRALNELGRTQPLVHLAATRLAALVKQ
jgi:predicted O-methyltransferase YrrM